MTDPKKYRLSEDHDALIREISAASKNALKEVDVVRLALDALGDYWNHHGKRLLLPLRFDETFKVFAINPSAADTLVLHEPPRAQSKSARAAAHSKTNR